MKLELISFKLCPFAQRAVILLEKQGIDYDINYINIMDPPDWFKEISPTGQVPLLKADNEIIFESAVISEFINDIGNTNMHPEDNIQKAKNCAWVEFISGMTEQMMPIAGGDEKKFLNAKEVLFKKLRRMESILGDGNFFNGSEFNIIDAAIAPIFMRLDWINEFTDGALSLDNLTKVKNWSNNLLADEEVKNSVVDGLEDIYLSNIEGRGGHLSTLIVDD